MFRMLALYGVLLLFLIAMGEGDTECMDGYTVEVGDIPGMGQIKGGIEASLAECGTMCSRDVTCCSFEYSTSTGLCNLNWDYRTTNIQYTDYIFCRRDLQSKIWIKTIHSSSLAMTF